MGSGSPRTATTMATTTATMMAIKFHLNSTVVLVFGGIPRKGEVMMEGDGKRRFSTIKVLGKCFLYAMLSMFLLRSRRYLRAKVIMKGSHFSVELPFERRTNLKRGRNGINQPSFCVCAFD